MAYVPGPKRRRRGALGITFSAEGEASFDTSGGASASGSAKTGNGGAGPGSKPPPAPPPPGATQAQCEATNHHWLPIGSGTCVPYTEATCKLSKRNWHAFVPGSTTRGECLPAKTSTLLATYVPTTLTLPGKKSRPPLLKKRKDGTMTAATAPSIGDRWRGMSEGERAMALIGLLALLGGGAVLYARRKKKAYTQNRRRPKR